MNNTKYDEEFKSYTFLTARHQKNVFNAQK